MAAPVLVTLITSWTASPTLTAWLPPPSTAAVRRSGDEHKPEVSIKATSPTNFIVDP